MELLGSYSITLDQHPRTLADLEWDAQCTSASIMLSANACTAFKPAPTAPSTACGTQLYHRSHTYRWHVELDALGPDGVWVGLAPPGMDLDACVGDAGCGWALHSSGTLRCGGRETPYAPPCRSGDALTVEVDLAAGTLSYTCNSEALGVAFTGVAGPLVAAVSMASKESAVTLRKYGHVPVAEYDGALRCACVEHIPCICTYCLADAMGGGGG